MKNIIMIFSVLSCMAFASGCDFLDVNPRTEVPADKIFTTEDGFEDALNGCYMKMNNNSLYGRFLTLSGIDFLAGYYEPSSVGSMEVGLFEMNYENDYVKTQIKSTYTDFYNVILQINDILENLETEQALSAIRRQEKRNLLKGEALALRAFLHFDILRLFGPVPKSADKKVRLPYSEVTGVEARPLYGYEEFVGKIKKDIEEAELLLSDDPCITHNLNTHVHEDVKDNFYHYRKFRFNYYALKALKARLYLYIGDTAGAYTEAMGIIQAKNTDGSRYFKLAGDNDFNMSYFALPSETIMGLTNSGLENNECERLFKNDQSAFPMLFTELRREKMFNQYNAGSNNRYNRWWGEVTNPTGGTNPYYKKYMQNEGSSSDSDKLANKWLVPLFRLSEIYLIAIESTTDLAEANRLYSEYMLARNVQVDNYFTSLGKEIQDACIFDARIEFMAEGQLFYAYKRTRTRTRYFDSKLVKDELYVVPVPESELK